MNSYNSCYMCSECQNKIIGDWYQSKNHLGLICLECKTKENIIMPNIKITAEVDGKIVPLNTISAESFEAIKALEKPKEIPVARVGHFRRYPDDRRLFLKLTDSIRENVARDYVDVIAIDPEDGIVCRSWLSKKDKNSIIEYENVRPL